MAPMGRPSWLGHFVESLRTELAIASIRSFALNASSKLLVLFSSIVLARALGADGFGIYASSIAMAMVLGIIAQLGVPTLLIRTIPVYEAKERWGLMLGLLRQANGVVISSSLLLASAAAVVVWGVGDWMPEIQKASLLWASALVPAVALTTVSASALRGLRHVVAGQLSETLIIPGLFLILILSWQLFGDGIGLTDISPNAVVALRLLVTIAAFIVAAFLLIRRLPPQFRRAISEYDTANWVRASIPLFFLSAATIVTTQIDVLMLVALQSNTSAGIYQGAARGAELVAFSLFVVSGVVQPTISRLHALGERNRLQNIVTAAARFAFLLALPVALVLSFFAEPILQLLYGPEFKRGAMGLTILSVAQVANVSAGLVGMILIMTGHVREAATGMALGAVVNIVLNFLLIPRWEIEGAAIATGVGLVVWNVFLACRVKSKTGLVSGVLGMRSSGAL
jgi:O-antigen/teichoic acid export membrane protein